MLLTPYKCTEQHVYANSYFHEQEICQRDEKASVRVAMENISKRESTDIKPLKPSHAVLTPLKIQPKKKKYSRPQNQYVTRSPAFHSELILEARASRTPVHGLPQRRVVNPLSLALNHRQPSSRAKPRAHARPCRTSPVSSVCHVLARGTKQALELGPSVSS